MRIAQVVAPVAVVALVVACLSAPSAAEKPAPDQAKKLSVANNEFGFDLLRHLHEDGENTFLSPTSIGMALQMTSRGAKGDTLKQMNDTMHVGDLEVGDANRALLDALSGRDDVKLNVANAIWADPANLNLNKEFAADVSRQFDAEIAQWQPALDAIARLLQAARAANTPVIHVVHRGRAGGLFDPLGKMFQVHAKDGVRDLAQGRGLEVPLGRGTVDFPELLGQLEEHNYRGYFTIERERADDPVFEIGQAVSFLRQI